MERKTKLSGLLMVLSLILLTACSAGTTQPSRTPVALGGSSTLEACVANTPCAPVETSQPGTSILAIESFLGDITRQVAGDRMSVDTLIPTGVDPHSFELSPQDTAKITNAQILVMNGAGYETWLNPYLQNRPANQTVIDASNGLTARTPKASETAEGTIQGGEDPHFWMNPLNVVNYVENIRDQLIQVDPQGTDTYTTNAAAYITQLQDLDTWIKEQVGQIPESNRLLVTNHESLGYFADQYGFQVVGAVIPSVSTDVSPSAQELAALIDQIKSTGAKAIFLETGANTDLAQQVADETGAKVITNLYIETLSPADGKAPTYIDMMKYDVQTIVDALR